MKKNIYNAVLAAAILLFISMCVWNVYDNPGTAQTARIYATGWVHNITVWPRDHDNTSRPRLGNHMLPAWLCTAVHYPVSKYSIRRVSEGLGDCGFEAMACWSPHGMGPSSWPSERHCG